VTSFLDAGCVVLNQWRQVEFWEIWKMRFHANALAALTVVPAIVLWVRNGVAWLRRASWHRLLEASALSLGVLSVSLFVFSGENMGRDTLPALVYLPLPFLLWAAVRFGPLGSSTCIVILAFLSIWQTVHGQGPFVGSSPADDVFSLQLFLIVISVPMMFLAALIEERRRSEQTRAQAAAIVESSNDAIIGANLDGIITSWNRGAEKLFGYSAHEVLDYPGTILTPMDPAETMAQNMERVKKGKFLQSYETVCLAKGGRPIQVSVTLSPVSDEDGKITGISSIVRDISERKQAEEALRKSEARLSGILAIAADAVISIDESHKIILFNEGAEKIFGYSKAEVLGQPLDVLIPERFRLSHGHHIRAFSTSAPVSRRMGERQEILGLRKNGEEFPAEASISRFEIDSERVFTVVLRDVTQRKAAEKALIDSEERLRLALEAGGMGVWDWNRYADTVSWSKEHFTVMGLPPFSVQPTYQTWASCVHPEDLPRAEAAMGRAIAEKKEYQCEYRVILPDGATRWVEARGTLVYERGDCVRVRGLVVDVTDRKRSEQSLRNALAEVQQLRLKLEADNVYLREELSQTYPYSSIVGKSEEIARVMEEVDRVAPTEMTALILGETGTGKELVARALHAQGGRNERPLVKVNCSALPAELIESELFGHEKGAFTGAVARQVGRFELADGGTIFLDEIGELPLRLQPKLLRVLQEGEFERLGSAKTIKVDVRVIAATNRNLAEAVQDGRFRADLYYRLNVYPIEIPPLRERREDIGLLAEVFLRESERRLGNRYGKIPAEVMEDLREYSWPGNVRELENVIARSALISSAPTLQLPVGWNREGNSDGRDGSHDPARAPSAIENTKSAATLLEFKKTHILDVLRQTNWRIEGPKGAALILGVHPNTLRSRLSKFGIQKPSNPRKPVAETTK
jgi:PAS domain S-box-containing protein